MLEEKQQQVEDSKRIMIMEGEAVEMKKENQPQQKYQISKRMRLSGIETKSIILKAMWRDILKGRCTYTFRLQTIVCHFSLHQSFSIKQFELRLTYSNSVKQECFLRITLNTTRKIIKILCCCFLLDTSGLIYLHHAKHSCLTRLVCGQGENITCIFH